jgi:hypothetical protein
MRWKWTWVSVLGSLVAACDSGGDDAVGNGDGSAMTRSEVCAVTACDRERRGCLYAVDDQCDECHDVCGELARSEGDASCFESCDSLCDASTCYDGPCNDTCVERGFVFSLPSRSDPAVHDACMRVVERDISCGYDDRPMDCDRASHVVRVEVAMAWDCNVGVACEEDSSACYADLPPGTLGEVGCAALQSACGETCNPDWRGWMNEIESWLRDDVVDAVHTCFRERICDDLARCEEAWENATFGD